MGIFDDVTVLLSKGMDAADKKAQILKAQSDLTRVEKNKIELLAQLGKAVLLAEGSNASFLASYSDVVSHISRLEDEEAATRKRIEDLQRIERLVTESMVQTTGASTQPGSVPMVVCQGCGQRMPVSSRFCSSCGDNLAAGKAQYRLCLSCGIYYPADVVFCEKCGTRVSTIEVDPISERSSLAIDNSGDPGADKVAQMSAEGSPVEKSEGEDETSSSQDESFAVASGEKTCPSCGALAKSDTAFCGSCGFQF